MRIERSNEEKDVTTFNDVPVGTVFLTSHFSDSNIYLKINRADGYNCVDLTDNELCCHTVEKEVTVLDCCLKVIE